MDNTYPEDFFLLLRQIKIRVLEENLTQIAIASNPHKDPEDQKEFIDELMQQRRWYRPEPDAPEETDFAALDAFKKSVQEQSNLMKAK